MPERIYKLQPNRTIQLRGFDDLGASAAVHSATANSFKVSGTFRDPADFAVLIVWDADNFYEHPRLRYLPDMDFAGLILTFDVTYHNLMPLDSWKYPTIDWPFLDVILADGTAGNVELFKHATLLTGNYEQAEGSFTIEEDGIRQYDRITIWFLNYAFDYIAPRFMVNYQFFAGTTGAVHAVTVDGLLYTYAEQPGDNSAAVASGLAAALALDEKINAWTGDGTPEQGPTHQLNIRAAETGSALPFFVTSSADPTPYELAPVSAALACKALAGQINGASWAGLGELAGIEAVADGAKLRIKARRPGIDGNRMTLYAISKNERLRIAESTMSLSGGRSDATWRVTLPFSDIGLSNVRMMWFTYAPPVPIGKEFEHLEWRAEYANWNVTGPEDVKALRVAGPGSVRIEENDSACRYTGTWAQESGFYSMWFARRAAQAGDSVTIRYHCAATHDLWVGTALYVDRGTIEVRVDGDTPTTLNTYLKNDTAVNSRRRIREQVQAGEHTVTLTLITAGKFFYFDFLEAVVASDVPDPLPPRTHVSPALDYSTDHTYKLPPARIHWIFDQLGYAGPMNEYIGVFWWNQRRRVGGVQPRAVIDFNWALETGDQVFLMLGTQRVGKTVFPNETLSTIAQHFAFFINATFVGIWARAQGSQLVIHSYSARPAYRFDLAVWRERTVQGVTYALDIPFTGDLKAGAEGIWEVDPSAAPTINRGAQEWHRDFFTEAASRGREVTIATSMELVFPPPGFAAEFPDGAPVETDVGFGTLKSTHCHFGTLMTAFKQQVYQDLANLMAGAGLTPNLQFGEFLWWFFTTHSDFNPDGGMGFYDPETRSEAQAALGRELHIFRTPDDDPLINDGVDAIFLRNRLKLHVEALQSAVRAVQPAAKFELLWPFDVNHPSPAGVHQLGGRLNRFVNLPVEWERKETSGLDRIKIEALDFGIWARDRRLIEAAIRFPFDLGWPKDSIRYLVAIFRGAYTWEKEFWYARGMGIPVVNLWAFDHVCIFGLPVPERKYLARSVRLG